jgi:hypothetical protein
MSGKIIYTTHVRHMCKYVGKKKSEEKIHLTHYDSNYYLKVYQQKCLESFCSELFFVINKYFTLHRIELSTLSYN